MTSHLAILSGGPQTMSSREIADLAGKEHRNVMRDIRASLGALLGEGGLLRFEHSYLNGQNKAQPEYRLPFRESMIVASGYDVHLRARIIDRWQELEAQRPPVPAQLSRMDLIQLALAAEQEAQAEKDQRIWLEAKVEADAPKVAFADSVEAAPDAISMAHAAKLLGTGRNRLTARLRQIGWLTRTGEPYQRRIEEGLLDVKLSTWQHPDNGLQKSVTPIVTGKGLARLREIIAADYAA
ncbi:MAG TPA: phage regulatory protein/antirepressor Ant [Sphingobium sp.]|uniref:phage regulatory protein/antirepressor Ant n=1 Tax=Sphingobium sp. TaxID=1912891 RepID=UPI002ED6C174